MSKMSKTITAGIDEAGRGALAGPVVAAACHGIRECRGVYFEARKKRMPLITDSKKLSEEQREEAFEFITKNFSYGLGVVDAAQIDQIGIMAATEIAMQEAVKMLSKKVAPTYLLVDGRDKFWFDIPHSSVIRGDEIELCISAASIIAKVTRDRLMEEYDKEFPSYGFAQHKGYGTEIHIEMLKREGECRLHRRTFLRKIPNVIKPSGAFSG